MELIIVNNTLLFVVFLCLFVSMVVAFVSNIKDEDWSRVFIWAALAFSCAFYIYFQADSYYCSTNDIVNLLYEQKVSIEVISKDKAIITKEGKNEFSYIELKTKEEETE